MDWGTVQLHHAKVLLEAAAATYARSLDARSAACIDQPTQTHNKVRYWTNELSATKQHLH